MDVMQPANAEMGPVALARRLLARDAERVREGAHPLDLTVTVFFDELNTSEIPGAFETLFRHRRLPSEEELPPNLFLVAAINPSGGGYAVLDLPVSLESAQVKFEELDDEDLGQYIREMIATRLGAQDSVVQHRLQQRLVHVHKAAVVATEKGIERVPVSQRDVHRSLHAFEQLVDLLSCGNEVTETVMERAMSTALWYAYVERFSSWWSPVKSFFRLCAQYLSPRLVKEPTSGRSLDDDFQKVVLSVVDEIVCPANFVVPTGITDVP